MPVKDAWKQVTDEWRRTKVIIHEQVAIPSYAVVKKVLNGTRPFATTSAISLCISSHEWVRLVGAEAMFAKPDPVQQG